jgi:DNA-binding GntR family transcriptional regulator
VSGFEVYLNRVSPVPLYHQLAQQLFAAIASGQLPKGTFLDNEIELAERWQVSRPTVRRAIQDLVESGMLVRRRGVGTQVVNDHVRRPFKLSSLHDDLVATGRDPATRVVRFTHVAADHEVAEALAIAVGTEVVYIERCRAAGALPLAVMRNWLIADVASSITVEALAERGLYALLRERGVRPHSAVQRLGAAAATAEEAELLGVPVGAPLVTMRRVMQDDTGRAVELGDHRYDAAHYSVEMHVLEN